MCIFFFSSSFSAHKKKIKWETRRRDKTPPPLSNCVCVWWFNFLEKRQNYYSAIQPFTSLKEDAYGQYVLFLAFEGGGGGGEVRKQLWWRIFVLFSCFHPLWEWVERNWNTRELRAIFLFFYLFSFSFRRTSRKGGGAAGLWHSIWSPVVVVFYLFHSYIIFTFGEKKKKKKQKIKAATFLTWVHSRQKKFKSR